VRTQLALGRQALAKQDAARAIGHFREALSVPENLGEAKHLLANQSDIHFWLGCALAEAEAVGAARAAWTLAAESKGDFQDMSVRTYSEMTLFSALALSCLNRRTEARALLRGLLGYARRLARAPARIDYFATSLPTMLLFEEDLDERQLTMALFLEGQARLGLARTKDEFKAARELFRQVLRRDPSHPLAPVHLGRDWSSGSS
jgi:tetratricopeptide (TPR) repeat protein